MAINSQLKERLRSEKAEPLIMDAESAALLIKEPGVRQWQCKSTKAGRTVKIDLYSGASVGPEVDTELTEAGVIRKRIPYQTDTSLRKSIKAGKRSDRKRPALEMLLMMFRSANRDRRADNG